MLNPRMKSVTVFLILISTLLFFGQPDLRAQSGQKGGLVGYVYQSDGTTPAEGAVVKFRNLSTGVVYESTRSDHLGYFKVESLDRGLYIFGAITEEGEFNAREIIGIEAEETAKLAIALNVQTQTPRKGASNEPPVIRGERFMGRVVSFDTSTMEARVFVEKGECYLGDSIHVYGDKERGSRTDFYQKAKVIKQENQAVKKAVAGQYYTFPLEKPALENDWVYLKEKSGLAAFFLSPIGMATVLAGTTSLVYIIYTEPTPVSVYRH